MGMPDDYPRFKATYTHEELVEHFLLSPAEHALIATCRGDVNRHGVAVLLKAVQYLGYFPNDFREVPPEVCTFIFATNSREQQEISTLCLQLLQNRLMLINTLLVERTLAQHQLLDQLSEEDRRALSPLFYEHVHPYGLFGLDQDRPSWLEAA
jgi:Domain of unknown function (DUF4158)/Tn3 transposase DDE domain